MIAPKDTSKILQNQNILLHLKNKYKYTQPFGILALCNELPCNFD